MSDNKKDEKTDLVSYGDTWFRTLKQINSDFSRQVAIGTWISEKSLGPKYSSVALLGIAFLSFKCYFIIYKCLNVVFLKVFQVLHYLTLRL